MKILVVNSFFSPHGLGGAERSVAVLCEELVTRGCDVHVLCTGPVSVVETVGGVVVNRLGNINTFWLGHREHKGRLRKAIWHLWDIFNPLVFFRTIFLLIKLRPDVIHTNNLTGLSIAVWIAGKVTGTPVVHTLRDYYLQCLSSNKVGCGVTCDVIKRPHRYLSKFVGTVVGNSEFVLNSHINAGYFSRSSREVVFNGYDGGVQCSDKPATSSKDLGGWTFGYLGSLTPDKGVYSLCETINRIAGEYPEIKLLVAGSGDAAFVEKLRRDFESDSVIFVGYVEPHDFYTEVDWVVVSSVWDEPLARVCFEPKFFGVPVIAANRGGNPEAITHGVNGFLYDPGDPESLIAAILVALKSNYSELASHAFLDRKRFEVERLGDRYLQIYSDLICDKVRGA
ncbi:MAG TPA: hypothetical protein DEX20_01305 [Halieaceae bacterium]|nr:hypothetical protein [Halieaceae bacterium]